jgi:predicted DNA-binding protein YlxM (UPF0122 family)
MSEYENNSNCIICRQLLDNLSRFFDTLDQYRNKPQTTWLTVGQIAGELKVSKSVIYQIIRTGELEAVNISTAKNSFNQKGHYRIKRRALNEYLESKKVVPTVKQSKPRKTSRNFPKVKNHLGL